MLPFSTSKLSFYNEISRKAEGTVQKNLSNMLKEIHIFTKDSSMLIFQVNNGRLFLFIFIYGLFIIDNMLHKYLVDPGRFNRVTLKLETQ